MLTALSRGQGNGTGEARDMYVPNPSCRDFAKYEWIGQLMGAALRGKEFLVSSLVRTPSDQPNLGSSGQEDISEYLSHRSWLCLVSCGSSCLVRR